MRTVGVVVALVVCVHAGLWTLLHRQQAAPDLNAPLASVSYSPYARSQHPDYGDRPTAEQIRADLKLIAPYTRAIRTYSSTGGVELVPAIAAEFGLKVTLGIWIDKHEDRNEREIQSAISLARRYRNVNAIVVGNETTLRADKTVEELSKIIQRVKRQSPVPVTTGEIWTVWLDHPELASQVDFIAAHILPYWDGLTPAQAVDQAIMAYDKLRQAHPGKRIVIAEFGWPSAGYNMHKAEPGRAEEAMVLRDFVARADAYGIDYNIIEAFDQPWKTNEGGVGMYWGIFDAERMPKFAWTGTISDPDYWKIAGLALALGFLFSLPILTKTRATASEAAMLGVAANVVGAWFAAVFAFWTTHYFVLGAAFALGLGMVLLIPLVFIALARIEEVAVIAFGQPPRRLIAVPATATEGYTPEGVDPHSCLSRAAGDAQGNARCGGAARLPEFRMRGRHQQHARSRALAAGRGPLPHARCALQVHRCGAGQRLQGRRAAAGADAHRVRRRDHRRDRRRLRGAAGLAQGSRAGVRRHRGRHDPGAAGSPRRRTHAHAPRDERRICRLLRHRHDPAQRGQRDHRARHDVPDPPHRAHRRRRLVERHDLRGYRPRAYHARARLADPLHQPPLRPRPAAGHVRGLQEAALPLGLWRLPDRQEALASPAAAVAATRPAIRSGNSRSAGSTGSARKRRRRGRDPQPGLGAGGGVRGHRHSGQDPDHPDPGGVRGRVLPFRLALSPAGRHPA